MTRLISSNSKLGKAHTAISKEMASALTFRLRTGTTQAGIRKMLRNPKFRAAYVALAMEHGIGEKTAAKMVNGLADSHLKVN